MLLETKPGVFQKVNKKRLFELLAEIEEQERQEKDNDINIKHRPDENDITSS